MLNGVEITLLILRVAAAILAAGFLFITVRAYRRTKSPTMLLLTGAVLLLAIGTLTEGLAIQGLGMTIDQAHIFESMVWLAAMSLLLLSVLQRPRVRRPD